MPTPARQPEPAASGRPVSHAPGARDRGPLCLRHHHATGRQPARLRLRPHGDSSRPRPLVSVLERFGVLTAVFHGPRCAAPDRTLDQPPSADPPTAQPWHQAAARLLLRTTERSATQPAECTTCIGTTLAGRNVGTEPGSKRAAVAIACKRR